MNLMRDDCTGVQIVDSFKLCPVAHGLYEDAVTLCADFDFAIAFPRKGLDYGFNEAAWLRLRLNGHANHKCGRSNQNAFH